MAQSNDKNYYLDWITRAHEEGCQRLGRAMSEEGKAALREIWDDVATGLVEDPKIFRFRRAAAAHVLAEAGELMARSAQFGGQPAVESRHVCAGTVSLHELIRGDALNAGICEMMGNPGCGGPEPNGAFGYQPTRSLLERAIRLQQQELGRQT